MPPMPPLARRSSGAGDARQHGHASQDEEEVEVEEFEMEVGGSGLTTWATSFYECAAEGDLQPLLELLDEGRVEANDVDVDGFTALMVAAAEGHAHIVNALLERGADVSMRTHELRSTALHFAAKSGDRAIVEAICKQDAQHVDCWNVNGDTPLIWACIEGRAEAVEVLLSFGADVNAVNQFGATTLICAVMIGEDPEADDSDQDRAKILRMLLQKNAKLVNFQDREGSTAMHLAASCGYLECVKTLLELGADITLRNAIGQTPLEEAEQTGVAESGPCVDHLRGIWKNLEEEAAARMMSMLEMEEKSHAAGGGAAKKATKKGKKAKRKAKATGNAQQQSHALATMSASNAVADGSTKAEASDASSDSSDDEADDKPSSLRRDSHRAADTVPVPVTAVDEVMSAQKDVDSAWKTAGKKYRAPPPLSIDVSNSSVPSNKAPVAEYQAAVERDPPRVLNERTALYFSRIVQSAPSSPTHADARSPRSPKVAPFHKQNTSPNSRDADPEPHREISAPPHAQAQALAPAPAPTAPPTAPPTASPTAAPVAAPIPMPQHSSTPFPRSTAPSIRPLVQDATVPPPAAKVVAPLGNGAFGASPADRQFAYNGAGSMGNVAALGASSSAVAMAAKPPTTTTAVAAQRFQAFERPRGANMLSPWRSGISSVPSFASSISGHASGRLLWKQQRMMASQAALDAKAKWLRRLQLPNETVDEALGLLACGICGELVNDNVQCSAAPCTQLYCASCLSKAVMSAGLSGVKCIKCQLSLDKAKMMHNHFAQAQAASLGLSSSSSSTSGDTTRRVTLDDLQQQLHSAVYKAAVVDISPAHLVPGAELRALSVGQLEVLEDTHQLALREIMEARIANARVLERLQIEEWMKTQRDILHFAAMSGINSSTK